MDAMLSDRKPVISKKYLGTQCRTANNSSQGSTDRFSEPSNDSQDNHGYFTVKLDQVKKASMNMVSKLHQYVNSTISKHNEEDNIPKINIVPLEDDE